MIQDANNMCNNILHPEDKLSTTSFNPMISFVSIYLFICFKVHFLILNKAISFKSQPYQINNREYKQFYKKLEISYGLNIDQP